jgi:hypothetical protein
MEGSGSRIAVLAAVVLAGGLMGCPTNPPQTDPLEVLRSALPADTDGWRQDGEDQVFDTESIFTYIDGHAEVYLSFGMKRCLSRRYLGPDGEPDVVLDLFEMDVAENAYGVFTHDRDGEEVDLGQGALLREGWLSFWQGRWFGSVYAEGESERSAAALIAIARTTADAISDEGAVPAMVSELPASGLDERSVRFFHTQEILNGVVYLGFDNPFVLSLETDAVLGRYQRDSGSAWLLLVDYPDGATAGRAEVGAEEAGIAIRRDGMRVAAVLTPEPADVAESLLADAFGGR